MAGRFDAAGRVRHTRFLSTANDTPERVAVGTALRLSVIASAFRPSVPLITQSGPGTFRYRVPDPEKGASRGRREVGLG